MLSVLQSWEEFHITNNYLAQKAESALNEDLEKNKHRSRWGGQSFWGEDTYRG